MCIVCVELGKGTITYKEALGAFVEVVRSSNEEQVSHIRDAYTEVQVKITNEKLKELFGDGPYDQHMIDRARQESFRNMP